MEKVKSLPPGDLPFQISAKLIFQIQAFFLEFSASTARLLDSFSISVEYKLSSVFNNFMLCIFQYRVKCTNYIVVDNCFSIVSYIVHTE